MLYEESQLKYTTRRMNEWLECPGLVAPSTSCLAATPAAEPTFMYMFSMRVEEKATADADSATGTSRFAPVPLFGTY